MFDLREYLSKNKLTNTSKILSENVVNESNRFEIKSLKGTKFYHKHGHTRGSGWGVYDNKEKKFVADKGENHPWDYKSKKTVKSIVDAFNTQGPTGKLHYARKL